MINVKLRLFNKYEATLNAFFHFRSAAWKRPGNRNSSVRETVQSPLTFYRMSVARNHEVLINERSLLIQRGNTNGSVWRLCAFHRNMTSWETHVTPAEHIFYRSWMSALPQKCWKSTQVDPGQGVSDVGRNPQLPRSHQSKIRIQRLLSVHPTGFKCG